MSIDKVITLMGRYIFGAIVVKADKETKTGMIRGYLLELIDKGELDLNESVSNARVREIARELKDRYDMDFNVNTVSTVIRELRVANSLNVGDSEEPNLEGESLNVESEAKVESGAEPKGKGGSGVWVVVGVIVAIVVLGVVVLGGFGSRIRSLFFSGQSQSQGGNVNVNAPVSS